MTALAGTEATDAGTAAVVTVSVTTLSAVAGAAEPLVVTPLDPGAGHCAQDPYGEQGSQDGRAARSRLARSVRLRAAEDGRDRIDLILS